MKQYVFCKLQVAYKQMHLAREKGHLPKFKLGSWESSPLFGNLPMDLSDNSENVVSRIKYVCSIKYSNNNLEAISLASAPLWPSKTAAIPTATSVIPVGPGTIQDTKYKIAFLTT